MYGAGVTDDDCGDTLDVWTLELSHVNADIADVTGVGSGAERENDLVNASVGFRRGSAFGDNVCAIALLDGGLVGGVTKSGCFSLMTATPPWLTMIGDTVTAVDTPEEE